MHRSRSGRPATLEEKIYLKIKLTAKQHRSNERPSSSRSIDLRSSFIYLLPYYQLRAALVELGLMADNKQEELINKLVEIEAEMIIIRKRMPDEVDSLEKILNSVEELNSLGRERNRVKNELKT